MTISFCLWGFFRPERRDAAHNLIYSANKTEGHFPQHRIVWALMVLGFVAHSASAQSADPLLPGLKPPDVSLDWKRLVGIYEYYNISGDSGHERNVSKQTVIFLERDQHLFLQRQNDTKKLEEIREKNETVLIADSKGRTYPYAEHHNAAGNVTSLLYLKEYFVRVDGGANPGRPFQFTPAHPILEHRNEALTASPPAENRTFRKPDLVELAPLDSGIHLDIRYATSNDFLGAPVYTEARAFLQSPAAEALLRVLHKLRPLGYGLLIYDGYRPWYVTKIFWDATPQEGKIFVADPSQGSRHNRGCAVDLTLYDLKTGEPVEMTGGYDEMSPRSFPNYPGGTSLQRWNRDLLRRAMESEGFTVYESEWWHFDYKDWHEYGILNIPFEKLGIGSATK